MDRHAALREATARAQDEIAPEPSRPARRPREILRFQPGHALTYYDRGREAIDAMLAAIADAQHHIHLETYILRGDATGQRVLSALETRAREGIAVRLITDAVGSRGLDGRRRQALRAAGVDQVRFNPPAQWLWRFRPRQRDHRKILVVDGRVGFLGGLNLGDEYVGEDALGPTWRDAHVRLEGPALTELQALFMENWFRSGGASFEWRSLITREFDADGEESVAILADGPTYRRRRVRSFFLDALSRARSHVFLVSPYFAPGRRVLDALADAGQRGVRVELLVAGSSDHPWLRRAARAFFPALLRRGVRVYEDVERMIHAKLAVFDDELAVIGTSNLDRQSLDHSCEVNAVIEGPAAAGWILERFGPEASEVIRIDQALLDRRSPSERWFDRFAALAARI